MAVRIDRPQIEVRGFVDGIELDDPAIPAKGVFRVLDVQIQAVGEEVDVDVVRMAEEGFVAQGDRLVGISLLR